MLVFLCDFYIKLAALYFMKFSGHFSLVVFSLHFYLWLCWRQVGDEEGVVDYYFLVLHVLEQLLKSVVRGFSFARLVIVLDLVVNVFGISSQSKDGLSLYLGHVVHYLLLQLEVSFEVVDYLVVGVDRPEHQMLLSLVGHIVFVLGIPVRNIQGVIFPLELNILAEVLLFLHQLENRCKLLRRPPFVFIPGKAKSS